MSSPLLLLCLSLLAVNGHKTNTPDGATTLVLAVPKSSTPTLLQYQTAFFSVARHHDNVLFIAGEGMRAKLLEAEIPDDIILDSPVSSSYIGEYAPIQLSDGRLMRFNRDDDFQGFAQRHYLALEDAEFNMSAASVVWDGGVQALYDSVVLAHNNDTIEDWAVEIQMRNMFGEAAAVDVFGIQRKGLKEFGLNQALSFVSPVALAYSPVDFVNATVLSDAVKRAFQSRVGVLELPTPVYLKRRVSGRTSTCGLYTGMLATNRTIYLPVFGNDPVNWEYGHSTQTDLRVMQIVQANTDKTIVPVPSPRTVCEHGGTPQALVWQISGESANRLVNLARMRSNIRKLAAAA